MVVCPVILVLVLRDLVGGRYRLSLLKLVVVTTFIIVRRFQVLDLKKENRLIRGGVHLVLEMLHLPRGELVVKVRLHCVMEKLGLVGNVEDTIQASVVYSSMRILARISMVIRSVKKGGDAEFVADVILHGIMVLQLYIGCSDRWTARRLKISFGKSVRAGNPNP